MVVPPPTDGLEILRAANVSPRSKKAFMHDWTRWAEWCREKGIAPLHASPDQVIDHLAKLATEPPVFLIRVRDAISRTYREIGLEPPTNDPRVKATIKKLDGKPLLKKPTDQLKADSAHQYETWVKRFIKWCQDHDKPHLPADPQDIAEFLHHVSDYWARSTRIASSHISRYHSDNGYARTSQYPQVKAVVSPLIAQDKLPKARPLSKRRSEETKYGVKVIKESSLGGGTKGNYRRHWNKWGSWCDLQEVNPLHATPDQVVQYITENAHEGFKTLGKVCLAITRVYSDMGQTPPTIYRQVMNARRELGAQPRLGTPADQLQAAAEQTHKRGIRQFIGWCQSHGKPHLPADPEDILEFLQEIFRFYSAATVQDASYAISRHHLDHGYAGPNHHPEVRSLLNALSKEDQPRKPAARKRKPEHELAPETTEGRNRHKNNWSQWCSQHGIDHEEATPTQFAKYLRYQTAHLSAPKRRDLVTAISTMYNVDGDPTNGDEVRTVLAEMNEQVPSKIRKRLERKSTPLKQMPDIAAQIPDELPTGLTEDDANRIKENLAAQLTPETRKSYITKWELYEGWCNDIGVSTKIAIPTHVQAYISIMAEIWHPRTVEHILQAGLYAFQAA